MNLPNRLTMSRLFVALGLFIMLEWIRQASTNDKVVLVSTLAYIALGLFLVAAITDFLDGFLARRRKITSDFGRIADPFADKVLICGSLVFLTGTRGVDDIIMPWVVVIILAREFLVTGLRGYIESRGLSFGAKAIGKLKMILQCFLVGGGIFLLGPGRGKESLSGLVMVIMIATVLITIYSGWLYIRVAMNVLSTPEGAQPEATSPPEGEEPPA